MEFLIAAFTIGLFGSFHCVGMCGPIALALPVHHLHHFKKYLGILLYNLGRVFTYSLFGLLFGLLGKGFVVAGFQQWLSIGLGASILLFILLPKRITNGLESFGFMYRIVNPAKEKMKILFRQSSLQSLFAIGVLNGLLPCGLVYVAVAGAIATASPSSGALFMMSFGLGTIPMMYVLVWSGSKISIALRNKMRQAVPVFVAAMAVMMILRGLNLGIPYLSPQLDKNDCTKHTCCANK
jgi:sulfite exporter TauE/SafE